MNDVKSTNSACKIPVPVLREAVRHASNDRSEAALQSLETYGLSEEQKAKISGIFQLCKGDPLAAPEWQRRIVAVINNEDFAESNSVGPGKSCESEENSLIISNACIDPNCDVSILNGDMVATAPVINNKNIAESNAVGPGKACENEEKSLVISNPCIDPNCDVSIVHEDILTTIFTCVTDSQSFVVLAKTCNLANKVFQSKIVQICFFNKKIRELSVAPCVAFQQVYNELPNHVKITLANRQPSSEFGCSIIFLPWPKRLEQYQNAFAMMNAEHALELNSPYSSIENCIELFRCASEKFGEFHTEEFLSYAQNMLLLFKTTLIDFGVHNIDPFMQKAILQMLCIDLCHNIIFSFSAQRLDKITPDTFNKIIRLVNQVFLTYCNVQLDDKDLEVLIKNAILAQHSKESCQQFITELSAIGLDRAECLILNNKHSFYNGILKHCLTQFAKRDLEKITPDTFDEKIKILASDLINAGFDIDKDDIKRIAKKVILEHHTPEEIEQYADTLLAMYENGDVIGIDYYKSMSEFYLDLIN